MELLPFELIEKILFKIHRFNYLGNISRTNKELNKITKNITNFHYKKLNKILQINNNKNLLEDKIINLNDKDVKVIPKEILENKNNIDLYNNISKYLFNYKILNLKYYNFIKEINVSNFIKIIILYDENCSTKRNNLHIIKYNDYNNYLKELPNNFIPFIILYIKTGYSLHLEYNNTLNSYRISLTNPINKLSLTKIVKLKEIIQIISFTENSLFSFIYKNYLLKFFKQ